VSAGLSGAALREAVAVAVHLEDVEVGGDAARRALGSQGLRPFVDRTVAGDQGGISFGVLRNQFKQ
jgi:hypothetical protein